MVIVIVIMIRIELFRDIVTIMIIIMVIKYNKNNK